MYVVITSQGCAASDFELSFALSQAVRLVQEGEPQAHVYDYEPSELVYEVERDTKVDEASLFYPAIVHRRR